MNSKKFRTLLNRLNKLRGKKGSKVQTRNSKKNEKILSAEFSTSKFKFHSDNLILSENMKSKETVKKNHGTYKIRSDPRIESILMKYKNFSKFKLLSPISSSPKEVKKFNLIPMNLKQRNSLPRHEMCPPPSGDPRISSNTQTYKKIFHIDTNKSSYCIFH